MKLNFKSKLAFALGDVGENFCWTFVSAFALIYFTDQAGLNAAIISSLMLLARVFDGFSDIIMGHIIDNTHHKLGKARPWLLRSIIPLMIAQFLLFNVPSGLSGTLTYAYIFIIYTLLSAVCYTMSNVSYSALTALITTNKQDRVDMGSLRFILQGITSIIINAITLKMVAFFGNNQNGWRIVTIIYCLAFALFTLITVYGTKEIVAESAVTETTQKITFKETFKYLLRNKYFFLVLGLYLCWYLNSGIQGSAAVYYAKYVLKNTDKLGTISAAGTFPVIIGLFFAPAIVKRFGIRLSAMVGYIIVAIGLVISILAGDNFNLFLVGWIIRGIGTVPHLSSIAALVASTAEYTQLKDHVNIEASVFSSASVGCKVGVGVGGVILGWALGLQGYDGTSLIQPANIINTIRLCYIYLPIAFFATAALIMVFMNVEKDVQKLRQEQNTNK